MTFRLPSSDNRRYLSGADWIINMIDHVNKKVTGVGNQSQLVVELAGCPLPDVLKERMNAFIEKYPIVNGRIKRDLCNLAPYWKFDGNRKRAPRLKVYKIEGEDRDLQIMDRLEKEANRPFDDDTEHLAFSLVSSGARNFLAMTFDHRLLDARGAEAFLNMFQTEQEERGAHHKKVAFTEPAHLDNWKEQFEAGRDTSRALKPLAENTQPVFPVSKELSKKGFKFKTISFNEDWTEHIVKKAYSEAGYLLIMPYILAVTVQTMHKAFCKKNIQAGDYIIPVSTDMRAKDGLPEKTFFNHVSFFVFRIARNKAGDLASVLSGIKEQMYDQVKSKNLQNFNNASYLLRIVPLRILGPLMRFFKQWPSGSFCSSYVGEDTYTFSKFMEEDVVNMYHMPRPPASPGLGIYFNQFKGRLNATISYIDGILSEDEVGAITNEIRTKLMSL